MHSHWFGLGTASTSTAAEYQQHDVRRAVPGNKIAYELMYDMIQSTSCFSGRCTEYEWYRIYCNVRYEILYCAVEK